MLTVARNDIYRSPGSIGRAGPWTNWGPGPDTESSTASLGIVVVLYGQTRWRFRAGRGEWGHMHTVVRNDIYRSPGSIGRAGPWTNWGPVPDLERLVEALGA